MGTLEVVVSLVLTMDTLEEVVNPVLMTGLAKVVAKAVANLALMTAATPKGTKVLALINASNNSCTPPLVEYTEFYNTALDHMDLMKEYYIWQNPDKPGQFSYCQYPFILSIVAKRHILTKDSEQQMILTARRSLVQKMARHQTPQIEIFFLNIAGIHNDTFYVENVQYEICRNFILGILHIKVVIMNINYIQCRRSY